MVEPITLLHYRYTACSSIVSRCLFAKSVFRYPFSGAWPLNVLDTFSINDGDAVWTSLGSASTTSMRPNVKEAFETLELE